MFHHNFLALWSSLSQLYTSRYDDLAALSDVHDFFERFSKFGIENRVDYRINEAVHVSAEGRKANERVENWFHERSERNMQS